MSNESMLADLVKRYEVCWEIWPEICPGSNHTQVGYEVELFGTNPEVKQLEPSSLDGTRIHAVLEAVAMNVFDSSPEVMTEKFSDAHSLRYSPVRGNRPDVTFSVKILHRHGYELPVDESERSILEKAKDRLRQLGAQEHCWSRRETRIEKTVAKVCEAD